MKVHKRTAKSIAVIAGVMAVILLFSACANIDSIMQSIKGELFGNSYTILEYDNFGAQVLELHGDKISLASGEDTEGEASSYIDITVDGYEWNHVGNTLVFAQDGVDMITDFQLPENVESDGTSTGLMEIDRTINHYKNMIGKKLVVAVYSQTGAPIGLFQGDSCYTETPADLPKTTKISIDGKLVYVHRANIDIFPAALLSA